ncbi:unnamed protein product, partial [Adineta ricciae]
PCNKAHHDTVIKSLKETCKEKDLTDAATNENQPDEDDSSSSSESNEKKPTTAAPAKPTTAAPVKPTAAPPKKVTKKSGKTVKPSKPAQVNCDKDHQIKVENDGSLTGTIRLGGCRASRFARRPSRCTSIGTKLTSLLHGHCNKLGLKFNENVQIVKTVGDKKATEFTYKLPCNKAHHDTVIKSLKETCKEKDLTDAATNENQPDEDDSSSSSESDEKKQSTGHAVTGKQVTGKKKSVVRCSVVVCLLVCDSCDF